MGEYLESDFQLPTPKDIREKLLAVTRFDTDIFYNISRDSSKPIDINKFNYNSAAICFLEADRLGYRYAAYRINPCRTTFPEYFDSNNVKQWFSEVIARYDWYKYSQVERTMLDYLNHINLHCDCSAEEKGAYGECKSIMQQLYN